MTEPTKEQVDKWKDEFEEKYLGYKPERTWDGYFETEIHMRYLAFECAKKSDFEEIKTLKEQLAKADKLENIARHIMVMEFAELYFKEKQNKDKQDE